MSEGMFDNPLDGVQALPLVGIIGSSMLYLYLYGANSLTRETSMICIVIFIISLMFAFQTKEKKLISIEDAENIAFKETRRRQVNWKIPEGEIHIKNEATLRKRNDQPVSYEVGVEISSGRRPNFVITVNCYTGDVERVTEIPGWTVKESPDVQVIVPPEILVYQKLGEKYGMMGGKKSD